MRWIVVNEDTKVLEHNICSVQRVDSNSIEMPHPPMPLYRDPGLEDRRAAYILELGLWKQKNVVTDKFELSMCNGDKWLSDNDPTISDKI